MSLFSPPFETLEEQVFRRVCLAVQWDGDCKNISALQWLMEPTESGLTLPDMDIKIVNGALTIQSPCNVIGFTLCKTDWLVRWSVCASDGVELIRNATLEHVTDTDLNLFVSSELSIQQVRDIYSLK